MTVRADVAAIRAALAADERHAQAAAVGGRWRYTNHTGRPALFDEQWSLARLERYDAARCQRIADRAPTLPSPAYVDPDKVGRHIERHQPAEVLRRVAAYRVLLEQCLEVIGDPDRIGRPGAPHGPAVDLAVHTIKTLAEGLQ